MKITNPFKKKQPEQLQPITLDQLPIIASEKDYAEDLQKAYNLGYAAGKSDGINISKQAAAEQLKRLTRS